MPLVWHVDGKQVKLNDDYEATITASGGYEQLTATVDRDEVAHAHQGSTITGRTHGGFEAWSGTLDSTPTISRHPVLRITATGPVARLRRMRSNWLAQARDYGLWSPVTGDPYQYAPPNAEAVNVGAEKNSLKFVVEEGTPMADGDRNGLGAWFNGEPLTRVAFTIVKNRDADEFELRLYGSNGPSGTRTLIQTWALDSTNPDGTEVAVSLANNEYDMLSFDLAMVAGFGDFTILSSSARTSNGTGAWQTIPNGTSGSKAGAVAAKAIMAWTAHSGTGETLDVDIETSGNSGTTTKDRGGFDQKAHGAASSGQAETNINGLASQVRAKWTIAGSSPSWTFGVTGLLGYKRFSLTLTDVRVNGRISGDDASPGEIIRGMLGGVGLNTTHVKSSGQNALPFYWEGGSWADAIAQLAEMDDWAWMVYRNNVEYSPWDTRWNLRFGQEAEDLDFPPIYNSVRVFYTTLAGAPRSVRLQAKPDPLARFDEDNEYPYDLQGSYDSDKVPTDVAASLLERVSAQQVVGSVTVDRLDTDKRVWTPRRHYTVGDTERIYHIRPGDLAKLEPYPKLPPQRIVGVRLRANDVQVEFGSEVSATRLLARIDRMRARQRRKP